jgi:hypothetical protein
LPLNWTHRSGIFLRAETSAVRQDVTHRLRIGRHLPQGDFQRYGYFSGVELQNVPPLVDLVALALRLHPSTDALLRHFWPEVEFVRVGLAEAWRRGLCVVMLR